MAAVLGCILVSTTAQAQEQAPSSGRSLVIVPRLSLQETWTNNSSVGTGGSKRSDFITEISPGIRISSEAGKLRGYFDYTLRQVAYASEGSRNNLQNALNASGVFEAIDNIGFIEASGAVSRQTISAFGPQVIDPGTLNPNATEVRTFRLSPYLKGRVASLANYELRQANTWTTTKASNASDVSSSDTSARFSNQAPGKFGWSVDLTRQVSRYQLGRDNESERARGVLSYYYDPELSFRLIGGQERNNYISAEKESHSGMGGGFTWAPNPRTKVSAEMERRFFGNSRSVNAEYRTARTAWRFSSTRDVSGSPSQSGLGSQGTLFDLFFFQFASIEPDPVRRAQLVNSFLLANGLNPSAPTVGGYIPSGVSLQDRQDLSLTLIGLRDTITLVATRSEGRQLEGQASTGDDFSLSRGIRQTGYTASYSRRMSPEATLSVQFSLQRSAGDQAALESSTRSMSVNWSNRIGLKTTATLGMRRSVSESGSQGYNETAFVGGVNMQF